MTVLSKLYPTELPVIENLLPSRATCMRAAWSRSSLWFEKVRKYADEQIAKFNAEPFHQVERCSLSMNDGCTLRGVQFRHSEFSGHMIIFGGTGQYCEEADYMQRAWRYHQKLQRNVLIFDYRGTDKEHDSDPTEDVFIQDGKQLVKNLRQQNGSSDTPIALYGNSFGGSLAILVAASLAKENIVVDVVSERSFRNLPAVVRSWCPGVGHLFAAFLQHYNLVFDAEGAIGHLKGRVIVIYHPQDYCIHTASSLWKALQEKEQSQLQPSQVQSSQVQPSQLQPIIIKMEDDGKPYTSFEHNYCRLFLHFVRGHSRLLNDTELHQLSGHLQVKAENA